MIPKRTKQWRCTYCLYDLLADHLLFFSFFYINRSQKSHVFSNVLHAYLMVMMMIMNKEKKNLLFLCGKWIVWVNDQSLVYFLKQAYYPIIFINMNICRLDWPFPFFVCVCVRITIPLLIDQININVELYYLEDYSIALQN